MQGQANNHVERISLRLYSLLVDFVSTLLRLRRSHMSSIVK